MTDPRTYLKDVGYVAVGLGVITFQRGQVRRRELEKQLADAGLQIDKLTAAVDEARRLVEERVGSLGEQLDRTVDTAVGAAKDATGQLLDLVRPASAA